MAEAFHVKSSPRSSRTGLIVFGLAVGLLLGLFALLISRPGMPYGAQTAAATPSPEVAPDAALKQLRATEDALLTTYGWVDRPNGIVHIPIDRAIDLIAQHGLPSRP